MTTTSSSAHTHTVPDPDLSGLATKAELAALTARVAVLEGVTPPVDPPVPPPTGDPVFLSRPATAPIVRDGGAVTISNVSIHPGTLNAPSGIAITVRNAVNVTIRDVDIADAIGGIYLYNCTGTLLVENVRSRNIGDGSIGAGHSNHIQLAECSFTGFIRNNRFLGGRTEDMLSIWHSGGKGVGAELIVENNHLQGLTADTVTARAWTRTSGTGIILSDGAGSSKNGNIICRNNTLLTPGQVCIQIIDGPNLSITGNTILAEPYALNNNPMTTWEGSPKGNAGGNRYYMTKLPSGDHPDPWLAGGTPSMTQTPANIEDATLSAANLRVVL